MDSLLFVLLLTTGGFVLYAFLASLITGVCSPPDRLWSIAPVIYVWVCTAAKPTERGVATAVLIAIWGCKHTYCFYRKGGYSGVEDYRWAYVRKWFPSPVLWHLFHFGFICLYQNIILLAFSLPAYVICHYPDVPISNWDCLLYVSMVFFLVLETVADQQMWNFQSQKARLIAKGESLSAPYSDGFITFGLFAFSRHPNFFSEMAFWWVFYGISVPCTGEVLHWSVIGPALLTCLFQGSTKLTEEISAGKYPKYRKYQQTTSRLIPWLRYKSKGD